MKAGGRIAGKKDYSRRGNKRGEIISICVCIIYIHTHAYICVYETKNIPLYLII